MLGGPITHHYRRISDILRGNRLELVLFTNGTIVPNLVILFDASHINGSWPKQYVNKHLQKAC